MTKQAQQLSLFDDPIIDEKPTAEPQKEEPAKEYEPLKQEPTKEEPFKEDTLKEDEPLLEVEAPNEDLLEFVIESEQELEPAQEEPIETIDNIEVIEAIGTTASVETIKTIETTNTEATVPIKTIETTNTTTPTEKPTEKPAPRVAVVILNWNGATMLERYLPSVLENSGDAEVIVADNWSSDDSLKMLERDFPDVRTIPMSRNWGFAGGYNQAFKVIDTACEQGHITPPEYFVLLNSDVRVEAGWLEPLLAYMDSHDEVAACQPKLLSDLFPTRFEYAGACGGLIDRYGYPYCRGRIFDTVETDEGQYDNVEEIMWASGACLMIRRKDYWNAGGLDRRFFAHNEEIDLCWRLNILGRKVVCIPQSKVYHLGGGTLPQGNPQKTFFNFRNNLTMLYKNLPERDLIPVMRMRLLLDIVAAIQALLTGRFGDFKAILKARREFHKWKYDFATARHQIQSLRTSDSDTGRTNISILWQYYAKRKKEYKLLP